MGEPVMKTVSDRHICAESNAMQRIAEAGVQVEVGKIKMLQRARMIQRGKSVNGRRVLSEIHCVNNRASFKP